MPDRSPLITRTLLFATCLGLYLTIHGYQSREGDQAYRLPLLLHQQDPALYAADPFVRAFDAFNPHVGYLWVLDATGRLVGLSVALALVYIVAFALACAGLDKLARAAWPDAGPLVGVWAVALVLLARAGNIGTNHLFESMLLDRGIGFALGWLALGAAVARPGRGGLLAALALGLAALVHPSVGLQLAMLLCAGWVAWCLAGRVTGVSWRQAIGGIAAVVVALLPAIVLQRGQGAHLFEGLPPEEFRLLAAYVQSPQHMLPHLWRMPQWLAWAAFFALAALAVWPKPMRERESRPWPEARTRLAILLLVNLAGLAVAYVAIEFVHDLRATIFQPFRMATVARGLALVFVADRVRTLWLRRDLEGETRAIVFAIGLTGDWALVVATLAELAFAAGGRLARLSERVTLRRLAWLPGALTLCAGLVFLARHDTERGHVRLLAGLGMAAALAAVRSLRRAPASEGDWVHSPAKTRRLAWASALAWLVPAGALVAACVPVVANPAGRLLDALAVHCRFAERPADDIERLGLWCRAHTPADAVFVGPPGPKSFRLWSQRSLAFNRAGSPYHAAGLADWSARFRAHVAFDGNIEEFAQEYLKNRQALERRYNTLSDDARASLALAQGAHYVIAAAPPEADSFPLPSGEGGRRPGEGPARAGLFSQRSATTVRAASPRPSPGGRGSEEALELLHVEGRYAVYRVRQAPAIAASSRVTNR